MQNYRDPPPYPGHSKQVNINEPGFRHSFSGSETSTDVSLSSTENLASTQRQEPQGEETQSPFSYPLDVGSSDGSSYSILERLGMPPRVLETAGNFHTSKSFVTNSSSSSASFCFDKSKNWQHNDSNTSLNSLSTNSAPLYSQGHLTVPKWHLSQSHYHGDLCEQHKNVSEQFDPVSRNSELKTDYSYLSWINRNEAGAVTTVSSSSNNQYLSPRVPPVSTFHHPHPYVNTHWTIGSGDSTSSSHSSITASSQSSSTFLSHTVKTTDNQPLSNLANLPPPPEYPGSLASADIRPCRSYEAMDKFCLQKSIPDLRLCSSSPGIYIKDTPQNDSSCDDKDQTIIAAKASCQMIEMLTEENKRLREELASCAMKVARLHKLEMEIEKVHESHQALVHSGKKREVLWMAMKKKLEERIQALETGDTACRSVPWIDGEISNKLAEKEATITKLLAQNQELSISRDELEGENNKHALTATDLRAHVDIFENALLNVQTRVLTLEEEKHGYIEKLEQTQRAFSALQAVTEKQEKKEKEMRALLEKELEMYRAQDKAGPLRRSESGKDDIKVTGTLRKILEEKDTKILQLETDLASMEQKLLKETTLRQLNIGEISSGLKDLRLTPVDKCSSGVEKLIDEAKTEKLKHMEELHQSQRNVAELEARVKQLESQLVEKDAILKVFQRAPLAMARSSSLHALCHSPLHSPRPSLLSSHAWAGNIESSSYPNYATTRHIKTGSANSVEAAFKLSIEEELLAKVQSLNTEVKGEDEVKLWHV
ncbi:angiomotin-like protein 1 [Physella acuta]|uniref:angiomotin-like protein 1 n=1 Tax=Physella acuta TaxID=109671 RepID=UPI0027DB02A5|nr:angiomotin-like protein 1 [Physella acuta]XP_059173004.1 angiomotin-like protein 1 [Physella acuta]